MKTQIKFSNKARHYSKGYRPPESYRPRTREAYESQQAALRQSKRGRPKGVKNHSTILREQKEALQNADIITFATSPEFLNLKLHPAQEAILRSLYGLPIKKAPVSISDSIFHEYGIEKTEGIFVLGARSGKSFMASIVALYEATREKWRKYLRPGETGYIVLVATRLEQAKSIIQKSCSDMIINSKLHYLLASNPKQCELEFINGMKILSLPCSSTAGRGIPIACLILDEVGHFFIEGTKADENIFNSLRPRMAQFPKAKALLISTPSAKQGILWSYFRDGFNVPQRLTVQAPTELMNPSIPKAFLEREKERDIDNYDREYLAKFAEQVNAYLPFDKLKEAYQTAGTDLPYFSHFTYECGIDQSGLSGNDKFGLAIAHIENGKVVVDATRSWSTTDADVIMSDIQKLKKTYSLSRVFIDRYGAGWVKGTLQKLGLVVKIRELLPVVYSNFKSLLLASKLILPDNKELHSGLVNTQAYYGRGNTLSIAHPRDRFGHADMTDAVVTAIYACKIKREEPPEPIFHYISPGYFWTEEPNQSYKLPIAERI
jgi:hypothetical protein